MVTNMERGQWVQDRAQQVKERILKEARPGNDYFVQIENLIICAVQNMAYHESYLFTHIPPPFAAKKVELWTDILIIF